MAVKRGLARGLDALLPESEEQNAASEILLTQIDPNPDQPRRKFDAEALETLAESIRQSGILQPLLVVENGGRYRIVAGERRFRAARIAGLQSVPCIVRQMSEQESMEAALIENLQREDLNAIEEAAGIHALMESCGYTQELAAKRVGRSRPAVANLLRLLNLPEAIQQMVKEGTLSAGHARVLAGLENEAQQMKLAELTVKEQISVRELEKLAALPEDTPAVKKAEPKPLVTELRDMRDRLEAVFGVQTTLKGNLKKGRIILQYQSQDELEALYELMVKMEKENG